MQFVLCMSLFYFTRIKRLFCTSVQKGDWEDVRGAVGRDKDDREDGDAYGQDA